MNKSQCNHSDCRSFIPIDVAKGFCLNNNTEVLIDGEPCPKFEAVAKCKNCSNFVSPDEKGIGTCKGFADNYWTMAELKTVTCEKYSQA